MNDTQTTVNHPQPGPRARTVVNRVVTTILRSRIHGLMSPRLLLITFTGRKSGKTFTTPIRYVQEGDILQMKVVYPWWKNLREQATVRVLLRGKLRTGRAEVLPEVGGVVVVKVHLLE